MHCARVLRTQHSTANDVAQLDVLEFCHLETFGVMVEVLVDLGLVHQIREELLQVPLTCHEDENRRGALSGGVIDDQSEVVDLLDKLLA